MRTVRKLAAIEQMALLPEHELVAAPVRTIADNMDDPRVAMGYRDLVSRSLVSALFDPDKCEGPYERRTKCRDLAIAVALGSELDHGWWEQRTLPIPSTRGEHRTKHKTSGLPYPACTCKKTAHGYVADPSEPAATLCPEFQVKHLRRQYLVMRIGAGVDVFEADGTPFYSLNKYRRTLFSKLPIEASVRRALLDGAGYDELYTREEIEDAQRTRDPILSRYLFALHTLFFGSGYVPSTREKKR